MNVIDLSAEIEENLWYYGSPYVPYHREQLASIKENGYITNKHVMTSHTGTHMECDRHWRDDGDGIDQIDLLKVTGPAKVLRFSAGDTAYFRITEEMIRQEDNHRLKPGDICIISTGWEEKIKQERYVWESPFLTPAAARYLADTGVKLVALDTPMIGDPRDGMDFVPAGTVLPDCVLLDAGIPYILGLVNTKELPGECVFTGAPLKLKDADGSPVRAFALVDSPDER